MADLKRCPSCATWKSRCSFHGDRTKPSGLASHCKDCGRRRSAAWKTANPDATRRHQRDAYRRNNPHPLRHRHDFANQRERNVWKTHRLEPERYRAMLDAQGHQCANPSCDAEPTCVDHDHACCPPGKYQNHKRRSCGQCVRWLLCSDCNSLEGFARGSAEKLEGMASLLRTIVT